MKFLRQIFRYFVHYIVIALVSVPAIATANDNADAGQLTDQEANELIADIKEIVDDSKIALGSRWSTRLSLDAALDANDYEAEEVIAWVKAETRWVPYQGILRGAAGVLMDRRGNSIDRSLLLANLLADAGYETRLARVRLNPAEARDLVNAQIEISAAKPKPVVDFEPVRGYQIEVGAQAQDLARRTGIASMSKENASTMRVEDAIDHWWVQFKDDSKWQNADLMMTEGFTNSGFEASSFHTLDDLPPDLFHRLSVELVIERWDSGRTIEETALMHEFNVAESPLFSQFEVHLDPYSSEWMSWNESMPGLNGLDVANTATYWRPSLSINGQTIAGDWFNDAGHFEIPPLFAMALKMQEATSALGDLGTDPDDDATPRSHLTAAWLEYRTSDPSGLTQTVRRELFDLLGSRRGTEDVREEPEITAIKRQDRGLALQTQVSNLLLTSMPHPDAVDQSFLRTWVQNREGFIALIYLAAGWEDERVPIALTQDQIGYPTYDLMKIAEIRRSWLPDRDFVYIDRPNVIGAHLVNVARDDDTSLEFQIDIVLNHVGVTPDSPRDPRLVRLEQGVLDTLAENIVVGSENSLNTFQHFVHRADNDDNWINLEPGKEHTRELNSLPAIDRFLIESALQSGHAVVASGESYALGDRSFTSWWQVNMRDGSSLGRGFRGWGNETGEYQGVGFKNTALKEGSEEAGKSFYCRGFYAIVDVTQQLDLNSPEFMALRIQDGYVPPPKPPSRMDKIKRTWSKVKSKVMRFLGMGKNMC